MDAAWPIQKVCIGGETYYRAFSSAHVPQRCGTVWALTCIYDPEHPSPNTVSSQHWGLTSHGSPYRISLSRL